MKVLKVHTKCRSCDTLRTIDVFGSEFDEFNDSMISKVCSTCGKHFVRIEDVRDPKTGESRLDVSLKKYNDMRVPDIPENRFTTALALIIFLFIFIFIFIGPFMGWL